MKMGMHISACSKVGWFAHPVPGHGKKSGYATEKIEYLRWLHKKTRMGQQEIRKLQEAYVAGATGMDGVSLDE